MQHTDQNEVQERAANRIFYQEEHHFVQLHETTNGLDAFLFQDSQKPSGRGTCGTPIL